MRLALPNPKAKKGKKGKKAKSQSGFRLVYRSDGEPDRVESFNEDSIYDKKPMLIEAKIKKPDPATF